MRSIASLLSLWCVYNTSVLRIRLDGWTITILRHGCYIGISCRHYTSKHTKSQQRLQWSCVSLRLSAPLHDVIQSQKSILCYVMLFVDKFLTLKKGNGYCHSTVVLKDQLAIFTKPIRIQDFRLLQQLWKCYYHQTN